MTVRTARQQLALATFVCVLLTLAAGTLTVTIAHTLNNLLAYAAAFPITIGTLLVTYTDVDRAWANLQHHTDRNTPWTPHTTTPPPPKSSDAANGWAYPNPNSPKCSATKSEPSDGGKTDNAECQPGP